MAPDRSGALADREPNPLAQTLQDAALLDELHDFLWTGPVVLKNGVPDHGWSCRDHALIVGQFLVDKSARVTVRHGKAMFVQGATPDGAPPVGVGQEVDFPPLSHTWLWVDDLGDVDVSPKLDISFADWRPIESPGIVASRWVAPTPTRFIAARTPREYSNEIALASHAAGENRAIYLLEREEPFRAEIASRGLCWAHSHVSLRLLKRGLPDDLYIRFAAYLHAVIAGDRPSLRHVSRNKAWEIVAHEY
jgi:hypothetical protein